MPAPPRRTASASRGRVSFGMSGAPAYLKATVLGAPEEQFGRILEPTDPRSRSVTEIADDSSETLDRIGEALGSGLL